MLSPFPPSAFAHAMLVAVIVLALLTALVATDPTSPGGNDH
jgi:hypothetical protein